MNLQMVKRTVDGFADLRERMDAAEEEIEKLKKAGVGGSVSDSDLEKLAQ